MAERPSPPTEAAHRIQVAGVVPCAGSSRRMGTSKALLDADGRTFLAAVIQALARGGCDPVVVVVAEGGTAEAAEARAAGARVLVNPDPGEGPITSLRLALGELGPAVDAVAFCPVDHPRLRSDTVAALLDAFARQDVPLALPTVQGRRGHPAILGRALFSELRAADLEGGARSVVHRHLERAALVAVDDPGAVDDLDTPAALRAAFPPEGVGS